MSRRRIELERQDFLETQNCISCYGNPLEGDTVWIITMNGPKDSPYMGGKFKIKITFPYGYPNSAPKFEFMTPICHININGKDICLGSLSSYNSNYSITGILSQIFMMLTSPNENNAFPKYRDLYLNHYSEYLALAREMTKEYAK